MRSGDHRLWDAHLATGRARADAFVIGRAFALALHRAMRVYVVGVTAAVERMSALARALNESPMRHEGAQTAPATPTDQGEERP